MASAGIGASYRKVDYLAHPSFRLPGERTEGSFNLLVLDNVTTYPPGTLVGIVAATGAAVVSLKSAVDGSQAPVAIAPYGVNLASEVACGAVVGSTIRKTLVTRGRFDVTEIASLADPSWGATNQARYAALLPVLRASGIFLNLPIFSVGTLSGALVDATLAPGQRIALDFADGGVRVFQSVSLTDVVTVPLSPNQYTELQAAGVVL